MKNFKKNLLPVILFQILFFVILRFSAAAKQYAYLGLSVWFEQMIPSLFPFLILSGVLIRMDLEKLLILPAAGLFKRLYRISDAGVYVLVMGFLCGFPMGAKTASMEYEKGNLSQKEAEYLLSFVNNIGPVYFLSFVYQKIYTDIPLSLCLFLLYGVPLLYGLFLRGTVYHGQFMPDAPAVEKAASRRADASGLFRAGNAAAVFAPSHKTFFTALDESIRTGFVQMAMLGGYMMICNLLVLIPKILFSSNAAVCALFHNLLEISGGLLAIRGLSLSGEATFLLAHLSLAFTGISCHLQTFHILEGSGLSKQKYMLHKLILCSILGVIFITAALFS